MTCNNNIASNKVPHTLTEMKRLQCGNLMKFCPSLLPVNQKNRAFTHAGELPPGHVARQPQSVSETPSCAAESQT